MDVRDSVSGRGADSESARQEAGGPAQVLTVRQKILMAAMAMGNDPETFSVEDLIVRAWKMFPESFSLRGFERLHPDSNRVQAKMAGADGLCGLGWIERTNQRTYRVTRKGRAVARTLAGDATLSGGPKKKLVEASVAQTDHDKSVEKVAPAALARPSLAGPRLHEKDEGREIAPPSGIERVFVGAGKARLPQKPVSVVRPAELGRRSLALVEPVETVLARPGALTTAEKDHVQGFSKADALRKFLRGQPLNFADACAFWGFSSASEPSVVNERLQLTTDVLRRAVESFSSGLDHRLPPLATCYGLFSLNRLMVERFARELTALGMTTA